MNYEEQPLPTTRRRSLFEDEVTEKQQDETFTGFPEETSEIYYPEDYIQKVASEIEQWKMQIEKALSEMQKFKSEKMELKNRVLDENILSAEQYEFFDSVSLSHYFERVKDFCDRATIFLREASYAPPTEAEYWYRAVHKKIEKDIIKASSRA